MITIFAPDGIAEITSGDDLAAVVLDAVRADPQGPLQDGDIVVVTSKIVSKAEGRVATAADREAMITAETVRTVARRGATAIVRTRSGLTLAAAGVDRSNVEPSSVLLLPVDPDASAERLRAALEERTGLRLGVIISDTAGRAWRVGQTDQAIGVAGVLVGPPYAGLTDGYGNPLQVTAMALADELAGAADLVKGKLDGRPVAVVRGLAGLVGEPGGTAAELVRPAAEDLFPLGSREAVLAAALLAIGRAEAYEDLVRLDPAERAAAVVRLVGVDGLGGRPAGSDAVRRAFGPGRPQSDRDRLGRAFAPSMSRGVHPVSHAKPNPPTTRSAGKSAKAAGGTKIAAPMSRRDKLASFEAARKKERPQPHHPAAGHLRRAGHGPAGVPGLSVRRRLPRPQRRPGEYRRRAGGGRLRPGRGATGVRQPGPRRGRDQGPLHRVAAGLRASTTPSRRRSTGSSTPWPTVRRWSSWCTTSSTATPSPGTATVRRAATSRALERIAKTFSGEDYNPEDKFIAAPWADSDGGAFPAGKNVVLARWTADPNDPCDTTKQFGVAPGLHRGQRPGDQGLHGQVPGRPTPPNRTAPDPLSLTHTGPQFRTYTFELVTVLSKFLG